MEATIAQSMSLRVQAAGCLGLVVLQRRQWWRAQTISSVAPLGKSQRCLMLQSILPLKVLCCLPQVDKRTISRLQPGIIKKRHHHADYTLSDSSTKAANW